MFGPTDGRTERSQQQKRRVTWRWGAAKEEDRVGLGRLRIVKHSNSGKYMRDQQKSDGDERVGFGEAWGGGLDEAFAAALGVDLLETFCFDSLWASVLGVTA